MVTIGQEQLHTRLNKVKSRLAGSFATAELIDAAAYASVCALNAKRCISDAQGRTSEPFARLLPFAIEPAWPGT